MHRSLLFQLPDRNEQRRQWHEVGHSAKDVDDRAAVQDVQQGRDLRVGFDCRCQLSGSTFSKRGGRTFLEGMKRLAKREISNNVESQPAEPLEQIRVACKSDGWRET